MFAAIRSFFKPQAVMPARVVSDPVVPPWRRPTFAENMAPLAGVGNFHGSFCRYCGDWIIDSAYYSEHKGRHRPLRGSWNRENPTQQRRDPEDITPNHEQWLGEMRSWAKGVWESQTVAMTTTCGGIQPGEARGFHSESEARDVLDPYGLELAYSKNSGWSRDGVHWSGAWMINTTAKFRERPGAPK